MIIKFIKKIFGIGNEEKEIHKKKLEEELEKEKQYP